MDSNNSTPPPTLRSLQKEQRELASAFAEQAHAFELAAGQFSQIEGKFGRVWERMDDDRARAEDQFRGLHAQQAVVEELAHTVAAAVGELRDTVRQNGELTEATRRELAAFVTSATQRDEALSNTMLTITNQQADTMAKFSAMMDTLIETQTKIPTSWRAVKWLAASIAAVAMTGGAALLWLAEHYHQLAAAFKAPHP